MNHVPDSARQLDWRDVHVLSDRSMDELQQLCRQWAHVPFGAMVGHCEDGTTYVLLRSSYHRNDNVVDTDGDLWGVPVDMCDMAAEWHTGQHTHKTILGSADHYHLLSPLFAALEKAAHCS